MLRCHMIRIYDRIFLQRIFSQMQRNTVDAHKHLYGISRKAYIHSFSYEVKGYRVLVGTVRYKVVMPSLFI